MDTEKDPIIDQIDAGNVYRDKWNLNVIEVIDIGKELTVTLKEQRALLLKCRELLRRIVKAPTDTDNNQAAPAAAVAEDDEQAAVQSAPGVDLMPITQLEAPVIRKDVEDTKVKTRREKRHRRRIRNDKNRLLETVWDDVSAECTLLKNNRNGFSEQNQMFLGLDSKLWKSDGLPNETFDADKYSGIYHVSSTPLNSIRSLNDDISKSPDEESYQIKGLKNAHIHQHHQFKQPRYTKVYWPYDDYCEAVGTEEMPFEKGLSDISGKPIIPKQTEELTVLSRDEVFMKLSDKEFLEECLEKSQTKRSGTDSMTAQERAIRRPPRDEHEVSQMMRLGEQFLPMMIRLTIMFFFIDVPRKYYIIVGTFVGLFLTGILDYPMRLIDNLLSRIFTRPPLIVQINNLAGAAADDEENTYDEEIPELWKRIFYQTVMSFFMLFMPWWSPDPHYLR